MVKRFGNVTSLIQIHRVDIIIFKKAEINNMVLVEEYRT